MKTFQRICIKKEGIVSKKRGMTLIELIVVLSIFSILSGITIFNYQGFLARVAIKNLANDIALKVIAAQKSAVSGKIAAGAASNSTWKPAYGVYFNLKSSADIGDKIFYSFADLDNNQRYDQQYNCPGAAGDECLEKINITNNNYISDIQAIYQRPPGGSISVPNGLSITFTRPSSEATFKSTTAFTSPVSYIQITVVSSADPAIKARINIYASGRIQIN